MSESDIRRRLDALMAEQPFLNNFGIGLYWRDESKPREERARRLEELRQMLRDNVEDVRWAVEWLTLNVEPIQTINQRHSSYGLKHLAEKFSPNGYLSNGVLIAAAMIVGYPFKVNPPNVMFGMSQRSIKELSRAAARLR